MHTTETVRQVVANYNHKLIRLLLIVAPAAGLQQRLSSWLKF